MTDPLLAEQAKLLIEDRTHPTRVSTVALRKVARTRHRRFRPHLL